jgi:hypothetical protein
MPVIGAKILKTAKGSPRAIVIPVKSNPKLAQDIIDSIAIEKAAKEPRLSWNEVKRKLDKKHKLHHRKAAGK